MRERIAQKTKENSGVNRQCARLSICGKQTHNQIWTKFCIMLDIHDVITYPYFDGDQLRSFDMEKGSDSPLFYWLAASYLTTLSLPCECVITDCWLQNRVAILKILGLNIARSELLFCFFLGLRRLSCIPVTVFLSRLLADLHVSMSVWCYVVGILKLYVQ